MNSAGPTAIHERHRGSGGRPSTATIACPNCGIHQPVEVEYDGDQGYGALPVTPCSVCHQDLCCFCDQASCECGLTVCLHCIVTVPDGTSAGLRLCKPCAQQTDPRCRLAGLGQHRGFARGPFRNSILRLNFNDGGKCAPDASPQPVISRSGLT